MPTRKKVRTVLRAVAVTTAAALLFLLTACNRTPASSGGDPASDVSVDTTPKLQIYPSYGDLSNVPDIDYSDDYSVKVNGEPIEVLELAYNMTRDGELAAPMTKVEDAHVAMFGFQNMTVEIEVEFKTGTVNTAVVRPLSYGIEPKIEGNIVKFSIDSPTKYMSVEINGEYQPLFIFADPPETNIPDPNDPFVKYYGPGVHDIGKFMKMGSYETLYISPGAILNGSLECSYTSNVTITGRGIVNGSIYKKMNNVDNYYAFYAVGGEKLTVEGVTFMGHCAGTNALTGRDYVFRNYKAVSFGENSDGINLTENIQVSDVFLFVNDDRLRLQDGVNGAKVERAVVWNIRNGNVIVDDRGVSVIKDVEYRDIDIIHNEIPVSGTAGVKFNGNINIKYRESPAYMSNIRFYNFRMEENNGMAVDFDLTNLFPWYRFDPPHEGSNIRDVLFSGFNLAEGMTSVFKGTDIAHQVSGIYLNNYVVGGVLATNGEQANMTVNEYVSNIYFNRGMLALKEPNYDDMFDVGETTTIVAGAYDFAKMPEKVEFYANGEKIGEATEEPYSIEWTVPQGQHRIEARCEVDGVTYVSSEMKLYGGINLLKNPSFEDSDLSAWQHPEGGGLTRIDNAEPYAPKDGSAMLRVDQRRETYDIVSQDVTEALKQYGKGMYAYEASAVCGDWIGLRLILRITDDAGTHEYYSNGASMYTIWGTTVDRKILQVDWEGELKKAEFVLSADDQTKAGIHPQPKTMKTMYVDGCHLNFIR